jgi:hypothetical protein
MPGTNIALQGNVTPAQFVADFPAFNDSAAYPENTIQMYLTLANNSLNPGRFGQMLNIATELFVAHFLTLDYLDARSARAGNPMGQQAGAIGSKSVGGVSINYALGYDTELGAGHWNLSTFGKRYYRICQMAGMGGVQATGAQTDQGTPFPGTSA